MFGDDSDREQFFESARAKAQQDFAADPRDAHALVRWGGALLELAHYRQGRESTETIELAIVKLKQALEIDSSRADAEWCLGNAYTSLGFLCASKPTALQQFNTAKECFKKCIAKDPDNDTYRKAIEMCDKAPEYYDEIQQQLQASGLGGGDDGPPGGRGRSAATSKNEFWWDVAGWLTLGVVVAAVMVIARNTAPVAPPPKPM